VIALGYVERGDLTIDQLDQALDVERMTQAVDQAVDQRVDQP
jgi:hypothetical protein